MSHTSAESTGATDSSVPTDDRNAPWRFVRQMSTETKRSFKTTELPIYVLAVVGVLLAAAASDGFGPQEAWKYVTWLTVGYLLSRGLAKSGSREVLLDDADHHR